MSARTARFCQRQANGKRRTQGATPRASAFLPFSVRVLYPFMTPQFKIRGDCEALEELESDLKAQGVQVRLMTCQTFGAGGVGDNFLEIAGPWAAVAACVITYLRLRYKTRRLTIERDGTKVDIHGNSPEEVQQMLESADYVFLKKIGDKKDDT
jgi:hypothetical protein